MMLRCKGCSSEYLEGELQGRTCPKCLEPCIPIPEEQLATYLISREQLPPFKCRLGGFGVPEVLVGYEASDGGRWACRHRDAEEAFRKHLQEATDACSKRDEEGDLLRSLDEFERKVHFLLSHAVHMGWWIHVPRSTMEELRELDHQRKADVEKRFALSGSEAPDRIGKLVCPECGSDEVSVFEVKEAMYKRRVRLVDGRIAVGDVIEDQAGDTKSIRFECLVCHEQWEAPGWIEQIMDEDDEDIDSPIDYRPTGRGADHEDEDLEDDY